MAPPVIIGAGLAGLTVALALAPRPVIVLGRGAGTDASSTSLAQGGISAAVGAEDSPDLHARDTMEAGAGLCDPDIVRLITSSGPWAIEKMEEWGVPFDRDERGGYQLGLEGAHSRRRVVHASGDSTGSVLMRVLAERVRATPSIIWIDNTRAVDLLRDEGGIAGVIVKRAEDPRLQCVATRQVVLATGSACALWRNASVPMGSWGHGLAMAVRAGARLRDMEFVQFHPTGLDVGLDPLPLVTEALRGEGAKLRTGDGRRFVDELEPRDIVARAIWEQMQDGRDVFLDARELSGVAKRFPTILDLCTRAGLDPSKELIPVRPVAHYHMGGVATDDRGRSDVPGLWVCGEAACTGLHGANRLASNSLLEAFVMGHRVAQDLEGRLSDETEFSIEDAKGPHPAEAMDGPLDVHLIRSLMMEHVGLRRSKAGLENALSRLASLPNTSARALVGRMIAMAALRRTESRGGHEREDFPATSLAFQYPLYVSLEEGEIVVGE